MIKEVIPGEKLTAKTQNEIIQACNGLMQPSGQYINTPNGSLYPNAAPSFNNMLGRCVETLFQLKFELKQHLSKRIADEDAQKLSAEYALSSVWYGYSMNLGNDFSQLRDQVKLMQPDNDDIFIIGGQGVNGGSDSEDGERLSVHLVGSQMLTDGSDKEGFFDLGVYWKSPTEGCSEIEVQKMQLSTDNPQYGPTKNAFIVRGKNYPSQTVLKDWYENKYSGQWKVIDTETATVGYVYNQKLVQLRTGLLFPETSKEQVDSEQVDSEISDIWLSSVQAETWTDPDTGNDIKYHQLFGFQRAGLPEIPPLSDYQDSLEVVLRDSYTTNGNGARVNYVNLSTVIAAASGTQTDAETTDLSSINRVTDSNALQLLDFDKGNCVPWEDLSSKHYADLVIRRRLSDGNPATKVDYIDFKDLMDNYIWKEYIGDSQNQNLTQRSVDIQQVGNDTNHYYAQLYNIANPSPATVGATLKYGETRYVVQDGTGANPNVDFQIVCRDARNGIEVKYDDVGIYLPKPSVSDVDQLETTLSGIVGQISAVSVDISADLSAMLSNYWKVGGTYNDNCYGKSIGDSSGRPQIDLDQGLLMYSNVLDPTVDWHNCFLMWNGAEIRLKWADCIANDRSQMGSIDWHSRILYDSSVEPAVDWENRVLKNVAGSTTVDWKSYQAKDVGGITTIDWNNKVLRDGNGTLVDWGNQLLVDGAGITTVEWSNRLLYDSDGTGAVDWNGRELLHSWKVDGDLSLGNGQQLKLGSTTLNETQLQRLLALI